MKSRVLLLAYCLVFAFLAGAAPAGSSIDGDGSAASGDEIEEQLNHANTFYWIGRARAGSVIEIERSADYLREARRLNETMPASQLKESLAFRIEEAEVQNREQLKHHYATIAGLSRLLPLVAHDEEFIEYRDDIRKVAVVNGIEALFSGNAGSRVKVIAGQPFLLPLVGEGDPFLEELARRSLGQVTDQYIIGRHELAGLLEPGEIRSLYQAEVPEETMSRLVNGLANGPMKPAGVALIQFVENDRLEDVQYTGVYYRMWPHGASGFSNHWYADGFAQRGNPVANLSWLLLLAIIPLQLLMVWVCRIRDPSLAHASSPPWWLAFGSAALAVAVVRLSFTGIKALGLETHHHLTDPYGLSILAGLSAGIFLVPLVFNYLVASRIPAVAALINNGDTLGSLALGSLTGTLAVVTHLFWTRLGADHFVLLVPLALLTVVVSAFFLGRSYSSYGLRGSSQGLAEAGAIGVLLALYGFCISIWEPEVVIAGSLVVAFGSAAMTLVVRGLTGLAESLKGFFSQALSGEDGEEVSSISRLRAQLAEPSYVSSGLLEAKLERVASFVAEEGLEDAEMEMVYVRAEAGAGKTRFAREAARRIRARFEESGQECRILFGDCDDPEDEPPPPYEPFAQAMGDLLGVNRFDDPQKNARALQSGAAASILKKVTATAGLDPLTSLLEVSDEAAGEIRRTSVAEMADSIASALSDLSRDGKIVFILDDVQWIDEDSLDLLRLLIKKLSQKFTQNEVSFVFASRTETPQEEFEEALAEWKGTADSRQASVLEIDLSGDDKSRAEWRDRLLEELQFDYQSRSRISSFLEESPYSEPLHILQILGAFMDKGWVVESGREFHLVDGSDLGTVKPSKDLQEQFRARLEGVDELLVDVLRCCATIGRRFRVSIVAAIFGIDLLELLRLLAVAEERKIVVDDPLVDDLFAFADKRTVAMFRTLSPQESDSDATMQAVLEYRKRYVRIISTELTEKYGGIESSPYPEVTAIANHSAKVAEALPLEALRFNRIAAEMSSKRGFAGQASKFYKAALASLEGGQRFKIPIGEEVDLRLSYVHSLIDTQGSKEVLEHALAQVKERLSEPSDRSVLDRLEDLRLAESLIAYRAGDYAKATENAEQVLKSQGSSPGQRLRANFYIAASLSPTDPESRKDAHVRVIEEAKAQRESQGAEEEGVALEEVLSEALNNLGFTYLYGLSNAEEAQKCFEEAKQLNEQPLLNDKKGVAISCGGLGDCAKRLGNLGDARRYYEQNLEISREVDDKQGISRMTSSLGELELESLGSDDADEAEGSAEERIRRARTYYQESLENSKEQGSDNNCAFSWAGLVRSANASGAGEQIAHELRGVEGFVRSLEDPSTGLAVFARTALVGALRELNLEEQEQQSRRSEILTLLGESTDDQDG